VLVRSLGKTGLPRARKSKEKRWVLMVKLTRLLSKLRPRVKFISFLKALGFVVLAGVVFLSLSPLIKLPGNWRTSIVLSGSMEPKIKMGSIVVIKPSQDLKTGDVITFKNPKDPKTTFTHRISAITDGIMQTKGDANNAPDNWEVTENQVLGKVVTSLPYLGYAANFAKTPRGFLLLVVLPAILVILDELKKIKREIEKKFEAKIATLEKEVAQAKGLDKTTKQVEMIILAIGLSLFALSFSPATQAVFSDEEKVNGNSISVAVWEVEPPPPAYKPQDVVINEVYYDVADDGSKGEERKNEWVELYNNTDQPISLKKWTLVDNTGTVKTINAEVSIPAKGFAVLSHDNSTWTNFWSPLPAGAVTINLGGSGPWLSDDGGDLRLKDPTNQEIDFVAWEKGAANAHPDWDITANNGESIARITKGVDTDVVGDWQVLTSPNPGTNPHPPAAPEPQPTPSQSYPGTDLPQTETGTPETLANPDPEATSPEPAKEDPPLKEIEETPEASASAQPTNPSPEPTSEPPEPVPAQDLGGIPDA